MKRKSKIIIGILLIILVLVSISIFYMLPKSQPSKENYFTVEEFNNKLSGYGGYHLKNLKAGDVVKIRDTVKRVEIIEVPEYELIYFGFSERQHNPPTGKWLTYTKVVFDNNESLIFT